MHSNSHLGISLAAMTHLAAATPNLNYACDTHYPWNAEDDVVARRADLRGRRGPGPDRARASASSWTATRWPGCTRTT